MKSPVFFVGTPAITVNLLKRRWSLVILRHLSQGPTDPAAICKQETDLSAMVVNERLRTLLRYSLITRLVKRSAAKTVLYELTPRGHKILHMLSLIEQLDQFSERAEIVLPASEPAPVPVPAPPKNPPPARGKKRARLTSKRSAPTPNPRRR